MPQKLTSDEVLVQNEAIQFAKKNRRSIARRLTDKSLYPSEDTPVAIFMSGSPGAGKTETSRELIAEITDGTSRVLRLDPDELRVEFDAYNGKNSYLFQRSVSILIEKALDYAFKNQQSFLLDGTLSSYKVAEKNIQRALGRNWDVLIIFVYQRPELAWEFVLAREELEGRRILPKHFVHQFFSSQNVVESLKQKYGNRIRVDLLLKDNDGVTRSHFNDVSSLLPYINSKHTYESLMNIIRS